MPRSICLKSPKSYPVIVAEPTDLPKLTLHKAHASLKPIDSRSLHHHSASESPEEALAAYEAARVANALKAKNQSQNGSDGDNGNGGNGNGRNVNGENGNDENGNNGNGNPNENDRGARSVARECTYRDFMKYQPLNLNGMEGVVSALTWWNSHKRTVRTQAAFAMSWRELMKLIAEVYCPRNEIQKMEHEL
nr:hypothetical protein [Tanacetum cinerariifolium]